MTFVTSPEWRAKIIGFEGKRNHAYPDPVSGGDPWTCGVGCTGPDVGPDTYWTDEQINEKFGERLEHQYEPAVNALVAGVPTTQGQFDALVSLAFNVGAGAEKRSSVISLHRAGQYDAAADAFMKYDHAGGREIEALANRRAAEGQGYLDASPSADQPAAEPVVAPPIPEPPELPHAAPGFFERLASLL